MPKTKPRILVFVSHYLPGFKSGGPVRTISNLVAHLSEEFHFLIVTSDRDLGDNESYEGVSIGHWASVGGASVLYLQPSMLNYRTIRRIIKQTDHDLIYLNSFFNPVFTLLPLLVRRLALPRTAKKPLIVAPRGEFSQGALQIKALKKRIYIFLSKTLRLYDDATWQASSPAEAKDIESGFDKHSMRIRVARDAPPAATEQDSDGGQMAERNGGNRLNIIFLSRISPMKNLDYAIEVVGKSKSRIKLDIFGPVGDEHYWNQCKALIETLPSNVTVDYRGPVAHHRVPEVLKKYDLFLLPTRGENYGHVIAEALSAGTPVLISDATPWRSLKAQNVGWDIPLRNQDKFVKMLEHFNSLDISQRLEMRREAQRYAREMLGDPTTISENRNLFLGLLETAKFEPT